MFNICLLYERNKCILSNVCFLPGPDSQATHQFLYQLTIGKYNQYCHRLHYALIKLILPRQSIFDSSLIILLFQDSHALRLRPQGDSAEVWQQPEDSVQRGQQQVRLELGAEERCGIHQGLATVESPHCIYTMMNNLPPSLTKC